MNGILLAVLLLAAFVGIGILAVVCGSDSRASDPRDVRPSWR